MNTTRARAIIDQIEALQAELLAALTTTTTKATPAQPARPGKRQLSEAGRKAIQAAARRRWAEWRKQNGK